MAMKETERSLRWYFLIFGVLGVLTAPVQLSKLGKLHLGQLGFAVQLAHVLPVITAIASGIAYTIAGATLRESLLRGGEWIKKMLIVCGAMMFINGALITAALGPGRGRPGITGALIGFAITIYLLRSVRRLSAEAKAKAGIAPPPPTARVV